MAEMLLDIIEYLETAAVVDGDGEDCFRDIMPETPDKAISLQEYGGLGAIASAEGVVRRFQVRVRSTSDDPGWAHSKVWEIFNTLITTDPVVDTRPTNEFWGVLTAIQTPFKVTTDDSNRVVYGFNVAATTYRD